MKKLSSNYSVSPIRDYTSCHYCRLTCSKDVLHLPKVGCCHTPFQDSSSLINPFSKTCVQIHLKNYGFRDWLFFSTRSYPNGILFYSESGTNRFLVCSFCYLMEIDRHYMKLWEKDVVSNVILCGKKLYALYEDGSLAVVDVSKLPPRVTNENMMELKREYSPLYQLRFIVRGIHVLVESCGWDINGVDQTLQEFRAMSRS